jgi:penicillin-binding protein 1A
MALPIVGKFFNKTYRDPKFASLKNSSFQLPEPELLAKLDVEQYKEMLDLKERFIDLVDIFKKDENKTDELRKSKEQERKHSGEKGNFWSKVKGIFKKKDK